MAGRPSNTSPARVDPNTGRSLPEGIRWRADRKRYQIRVTVTDLAGNKQHRSRMFLTLAEAKRELAKEVSGRNPNASMTLAQWHERYWPAVAASVRAGTARGYDVSWRKRVQPTLGDKKLEEITSPLIESARFGLAGERRFFALATARAAEMAQEWPKVAEGSGYTGGMDPATARRMTVGAAQDDARAAQNRRLTWEK